MTQQLTLFDSPERHISGFIYWATDGVNLKHGYTTRPVRRGGELKLTMLWTEPGTVADEQAWHRRWLRHRIPGTAEWYYPHPALLEYLDGLVPPCTHARAVLRMLIFRWRNAA